MAETQETDNSQPESTAPKPAKREPQPATDETVKETIESIIIAFILAFVFRAFIVEPFIIPTGSMAPTMLGAHLQKDCPSCGYKFDVGVDASIAPEGGTLGEVRSADCPMCNYPVLSGIGTKVKAGDRILVDKFSYHLHAPSRWDVVVFKAPKGRSIGGELAPRTNFIKRLIALPGERVALLDGNVFIAPAGTNDFAIARKTDPKANPHWQDIQRTAWQPIYHSQYVPIESGLADAPGRDAWHTFRVPWEVQSGRWELGTARRPSRVYTFKGGRGAIRFAFTGLEGAQRYDGEDARFPYNQLSTSVRDGSPIEDVRLACAVSPTGMDTHVTLSTTARLDQPEQGVETLQAQYDGNKGELTLRAVSLDGSTRDLGDPAKCKPMKPGIATQFELWLVDDEASVWVDGERVLVQRFDLGWDEMAKRPEASQTPEVQIAVDSPSEVEIRRVELDRDIYYFADRYPPSGFSRAEARRQDGRLVVGPTPLDLREHAATHDAEYFVLGDNQPASEDGRGWSDVDGWVRQRYFDGDERAGVVPDSLLVGRAFMVYYPAPHGASPQAKGVFPDFGRMRFVH